VTAAEAVADEDRRGWTIKMTWWKEECRLGGLGGRKLKKFLVPSGTMQASSLSRLWLKIEKDENRVHMKIFAALEVEDAVCDATC
jgi:hypothetical protein